MARSTLAAPRRMAAGALRHRMTIEAPTSVDDGQGGLSRTYNAVDEVWASIETIGAEETADDNRAGARLLHRIQTRWRADIDSSTRLRLGARLFRIRSVADADHRRARLSIVAEEETP